MRNKTEARNRVKSYIAAVLGAAAFFSAINSWEYHFTLHNLNETAKNIPAAETIEAYRRWEDQFFSELPLYKKIVAIPFRLVTFKGRKASDRSFAEQNGIQY